MPYCDRGEMPRGGTSAGNIGNYWLAFEGARTTLGCEPFHLEVLMPDPLPFDDIPLDEQARQYRALIADLEERLSCARRMLAVVEEQIEIEAGHGA